MEGYELLSRVWRFQSAVFDSMANEISDVRLHPKSMAVLQMMEFFRYPNEVARCLSVPMPTLSNILRELERNGYIRRDVDETDRRRVLLHVTPSGKSALDKATKVINDRLGPKIAQLSQTEVRELRSGLDALEAMLGNPLVDTVNKQAVG